MMPMTGPTPANNGTRVEIPCIGEQFPQMEVTTTHGPMTLPDHYAGKWFMLFSHPGDFTPVCTTEFASFAYHHEEFRALGCELIGLSIDQVHSHIIWVQWIKEKLGVTITFPIIADPFGETARALGAIHPASGKGAIRAIIMVDPRGQVRSLMYYPKGVGRNLKELLRTMRAMQIVEKYHVATPANWPESEFVGSDVLLHAPSTEVEAEQRKGKQGCLDWWFCHETVGP
jgi:peroxiredoxin (alkyl hydroperoxide reductase subunit C)